MGYLRSLPKLSAITLLVSQAFLSLPSHAAGYQLDEVSPSLQGAATAGSAAANNDVSAMFSNPATLSTLTENQAYLGASEIIPHVRMKDASATHTVNIPGLPPSSITAPVLGRASQRSVGQSALVPDGYLSWRINNQLVAGLAVVGPFGLTTKYHNDSVVRFAADYSAVRSLDIVPSIAYKINEQWAVGVGLQAQYLKGTFSNFDGPYTGVSIIDAFVAADQPTRLKGTDWGYGYTLGALYKPDLCTRLGIGYRSLISEQLTGHGRQFTAPGGISPAPSGDFPFNARSSVHAGVKTPAVLTLSAARDIDKWTVKASAQVNFWNTFNHLGIHMPDAFATYTALQTKWRNAWFGAIGADYRANCAWTVRGGLAYDQTPTRNKFRDPRIPDSDRFWATVGASYMWTKQLSFDGAYEHIFFRNQKVNVTENTGQNSISTLPLEVNQVKAHFKGSADIVALAVRYSF